MKNWLTGSCCNHNDGYIFGVFREMEGLVGTADCDMELVARGKGGKIV